jgi:hypothetical protein
MPAPHWFFRFMYDRESASWERRRDEPGHRELVKRVAGELANVVHRPGQWPTSAADLARTRSLSRGAVMTSSVLTGHGAWSRSRGHEPLATRST